MGELINKKGCLHKVITTLIVLFLLVFLLASAIAWYNSSLPDSSPAADELSKGDFARIMEARHLMKELGDEIWPGFGNKAIPVLLYNESHAFLYGMKDPADGWIRYPGETIEGGAWEKAGEDWYKQPLPEDKPTPQAFIVEIGDTLVSSMTTLDWTHIKMRQTIGDELPSFLEPVFPYAVFTIPLNHAWHVSSIIHEAFHAYQAEFNPGMLRKSESLAGIENNYPWNNETFRGKWVNERTLLADAMLADGQERYSILDKWKNERMSRRNLMDSTAIEFERYREWSEGLAKYAEIQSRKLAHSVEEYSPIEEMIELRGFDNYNGYSSLFNREINQLKSDLGFSESIFYYSGWIQAGLLDEIKPDWKTMYMQNRDTTIFLDEILFSEINQN